MGRAQCTGVLKPAVGCGEWGKAMSVQTLEHLTLRIALQKVHWTENLDDFPRKLNALRNFPWNLLKIRFISG